MFLVAQVLLRLAHKVLHSKSEVFQAGSFDRRPLWSKENIVVESFSKVVMCYLLESLEDDDVSAPYALFAARCFCWIEKLW